jgi:hypothetical protein
VHSENTWNEIKRILIICGKVIDLRKTWHLLITLNKIVRIRTDNMRKEIELIKKIRGMKFSV